MSRRPTMTVRDRALSLLAKREYSHVELKARLARRGADSEEVEAVLRELEERGWLSDERFADNRVRSRAGTVSRRYIAAELKQHGVATPVAEQALSQLEQNDYETALSMWRHKFGKPPLDQKEKARQVRYLQARGFALDLVLRLLRAEGARLDDPDGG